MVRFDRPCKAVAGAVGYFREHLRIGDYLSDHGSVEMTWFGTGAERLALSGSCRLEDFESVCRGRDPRTGHPLVVRSKASRRVCFFGQVSAPKDVSVLALVGGDKRILRWWDDAVHETLTEIEATAATRVRRRGAHTDRETGNLVAALVTHETSRALDPQLHTHLCVMNMTFDATENRWKGLQPDGLYRHQAYFREVCYNRLATLMRAGGYELEPSSRGFRVVGFPAKLRDLFSKRRHQILAAAKQSGAKSQDALQAIAGASRLAKQSRSASELRQSWCEEAGEHCEALRQLVEGSERVRPRALEQASYPLARTIERVFERRSTLDERSLLREALADGRGTVSLPDLKRRLRIAIDDGMLIRMGHSLTTAENLAAEQEILRFAQAGTGTFVPLGTLPTRASLNPEQRVAVDRLLRSRDRVTLLQGDAGTGKTTSLRALIAGCRMSAFACAPSAGATDVLRRELTLPADTLQRLLVDAPLQGRLRGHLLLVDEAGLVSVRQMRDLFRLAQASGCRVLLVGDTKQHTSVEAGDAFRALQRYSGLPVARLTRIQRQADARHRTVVSLLAKGEAGAAFRLLDRIGGIHEAPHPALFAQAAASYLYAISAGRSCLAIAPVWSEIDWFTTEVRQLLRASGRLDRNELVRRVVDPLHWTKAEIRDPANYRPGDVLTFHRTADGFRKGSTAEVIEVADRSLTVLDARGRRGEVRAASLRSVDVGRWRDLPIAQGERLLVRINDRTLGLRNGDLVTVSKLHRDGGIELTDGRTLPAGFRHCTYGYATTSHAAQGKTVDEGIFILGAAGLAAADLKTAYVANSRFRERQLVFTTDKAAAKAALSRPADRLLALESGASQSNSGRAKSPPS